MRKTGKFLKNRVVQQPTGLLNKSNILNMDINAVLDRLVYSLKPSDPYKIVLFGSCADGSFNENSDMDIMVILDNNHISKTYEERLNKKILVRRLVLEINREMPLDILVYSKEELNEPPRPEGRGIL